LRQHWRVDIKWGILYKVISFLIYWLYIFCETFLNNDTDTNTKNVIYSKRKKFYFVAKRGGNHGKSPRKESSKNLFSSLFKNHHVPHFHRGMKDVMRILKVKISHITLILLKFLLPIFYSIHYHKSFSFFLLSIFFFF